MKTIHALLASCWWWMAAQNTAPPKTTLKVGDEAPDFSLPDTTSR